MVFYRLSVIMSLQIVKTYFMKRIGLMDHSADTSSDKHYLIVCRCLLIYVLQIIWIIKLKER